MKIVVIGATGLIGAAVVRALAPRHEVIGVSRHSDPSVDVAVPATITGLFQTIQNVDAVVCCAGSAAWQPLAQLTDEDFGRSVGSKLMGQVNVVRAALGKLQPGGSVTVTSGVLAQQPIPNSAAVSLVNAGLEGFVRSAALEAPNGIRVNVVSPPWVKEKLDSMKKDSAGALSAADLAKSYVAAVEGTLQGETIDPTRFA